MKTVKIICFTGDSGLTDYSVALAHALSRRASVELLTATSLLPRFARMGFATNLVFRRSRHYAFDLPRALLHIVRQHPHSVLLQGPLKLPLLEGLVSKFFRVIGISTALTIHDVLPHYPRRWSRIEFSWFYQRFDRIIVHSDAALHAVQGMGVTRPILVVPHGTYDLFRLTGISRSAARHSLPQLSENDFVVLFFGHLELRKGLSEIIEVARRMGNLSGLKFLIAGQIGEHLRHIGPLLEKARALPNVVLHDFRVPFEEVERYFSASNVVALPYHEGSTSGVLKLAIAFGIPVVASRVGDIPEQIPLGAGELFDAGPAMCEDLQSAIEKVHTDPASYEAAMRHASQGSSWDHIADAYANFIF